jgi:formiminoglutamase
MEDPRLGDIIKPLTTLFTAPFKGDIVILGFPFDEGVKRNGGRVGASRGPRSFRTYMNRVCATNARTGTAFADTLTVLDAGDIQSGSLETGHDALSQAVYYALVSGAVPVVIGGGNDQSYANVRGLLAHLTNTPQPTPPKVTVINIDAHLDVRPLKAGQVHSGSPFRLMLEDPIWTSRVQGHFIEFCAQPAQCAVQHAAYARQQGTKIMWLEDVQQRGVVASFRQLLLDAGDDGHVFVSFDIDAIRASDCPVSSYHAFHIKCSGCFMLKSGWINSAGGNCNLSVGGSVCECTLDRLFRVQSRH